MQSNEIAVNEFLNKKINYTDIIRIVEKVMELHKTEDIFSIEDSLARRQMGKIRS